MRRTFWFLFKLALVLGVLAGGVVAWIVLRSPDPTYAAYELVFHESFHRYDPVIKDVARRRGIDPMVLKAVVWRESRFRPGKVGLNGERGLMQITDAAAREWVKSEKIANFVPGDLVRSQRLTWRPDPGCSPGRCIATETGMIRCRLRWRSTTRGAPAWQDGPGPKTKVKRASRTLARIAGSYWQRSTSPARGITSTPCRAACISTSSAASFDWPGFAQRGRRRGNSLRLGKPFSAE